MIVPIIVKLIVAPASIRDAMFNQSIIQYNYICMYVCMYMYRGASIMLE